MHLSLSLLAKALGVQTRKSKIELGQESSTQFFTPQLFSTSPNPTLSNHLLMSTAADLPMCVFHSGCKRSIQLKENRHIDKESIALLSFRAAGQS